MAKRSPRMQSKHDAKVKQLAISLRRKGWKVKTDIKGYERPDPIGKNRFIPDIQAEKAGAKKLIEVETRDTMVKDKKQHEAFRRSAALRKRTAFTIEEI